MPLTAENSAQEDSIPELSKCEDNPSGGAVTFSWNNINVFLDASSIWQRTFCKHKPVPRKHILKNVSGEVRPGHLVAILGSSGAGKTTLLNVLTRRSLDKLIIDGNIRVNGQTVDSRSITRMSAYVQQEDLFFGLLTVREHLNFQAQLRMDRNIPQLRRRTRVQEVIQELGLIKCADSRIGTPGMVKGISGGEMKRLSFASEILTNPSLMFCDEPTSGLDSFTAMTVASVLKEMAACGRTILCTIHQPSSEVYDKFNQIMLLANGMVAFMGTPSDCLRFFDRFGYPCPLNYNPADFFVAHLAVVPGMEEASLDKIQKFCIEYDNMKAVEISDRRDSVSSFSQEDIYKTSGYKASWYVQLRVLMIRSFLTMRRNKSVTVSRIAQSVVLSAMVAVVYVNQKMNQAGVKNINGAIYLMLTNLTFQTTLSVVNVFCQEIPLFLREHWNGMYRTDVYFLSKTCAELPLFIITPILFTALPYWAIGMYPAVTTFFISLALFILITNVTASFGYMLSCFASSLPLALSLISPLVFPLMMCGGFFNNSDSLPVYLVWVKYISWFYYGNEALNINQWRDVLNIDCANGTSFCLHDGQAVLQVGSYKEENFYFDIIMLGVLLAAFRVVAFIGLLLKSRERR